MNCEEVQAFFVEARASDRPLPEDILEHLLSCERCGAQAGVNGAEWELPSALHGRILGDLANSLDPVDALPSRTKLVLRTAFIFVLLPLLIVSVLGPVEPLLPIPQLTCLASVIAGSEIFLALALVSLMVPGCRPRIPPKLLIGLCILANSAVIVMLFPQGKTEALEIGTRCFVTGCLAAVPAATLLYLFARRGAILDRATAGTVVGLLAGLVGLTVLLANCNNLGAGHLAVWHIGVLLTVSTLGLSFGALSISRT